MNSDEKLRCPSCGSLDVRPSLAGGLLDSLMMAFGRSPFRCRGCRRRFYRGAAKSEDAEEPEP